MELLKMFYSLFEPKKEEPYDENIMKLLELLAVEQNSLNYLNNNSDSFFMSKIKYEQKDSIRESKNKIKMYKKRIKNLVRGRKFF